MSQRSLFDPPPPPAPPARPPLAPKRRLGRDGRPTPRAGVDPIGHLDACGVEGCPDCLYCTDNGFGRCSTCGGWVHASAAIEGECSRCAGRVNYRGEVLFEWPPAFKVPKGSIARALAGERLPWEGGE